MAQQFNRSAERLPRDMLPSAPEQVAVVKAESLRCFPPVRVRETRPTLRLNLCYS
jgi:hypothetical protein